MRPPTGPTSPAAKKPLTGGAIGYYWYAPPWARKAGYPIKFPGVDAIELIIGDQVANWLLIPLEFRLDNPSFAIRNLPIRLRINSDWLRPAKLLSASGQLK